MFAMAVPHIQAIPLSSAPALCAVIDDPLQNILHAASMIVWARTQQRPGNWLAVIGEMDWLTEMHRTMERLRTDG